MCPRLPGQAEQAVKVCAHSAAEAVRPALPRPPLQAFEAASGLKVNMNLTHRRPGDAEAVWAATETAERELG